MVRSPREVPPALEAVCLKCPAKKPADRNAAAADVARELDAKGLLPPDGRAVLAKRPPD